MGVKSVVAGFTAGHSDEDGGAESVMITFDPRVISYGQLLQILFSVVHDPTQMNRQGPDVGPGYRSDIFYVDDTQKRIAQAYIAQLDEAKVFPSKIVTRIDRFQHFDPAGPAQQDFMIKNPRLQYIVVNDLPKLAALQEAFPRPIPRFRPGQPSIIRKSATKCGRVIPGSESHGPNRVAIRRKN